ncbi:UNVERIFIED_CONTAM: hypothetical protein GTU68_029862 [Idotea baltica]|nr:hypothetical protein [Idotea baltica]
MPAVLIITAYLLGSVSFGILISKVFGLADPRTVGSGNPGATNVLRSGKKSAALLTLVGDAVKGWLPVWLVLCANVHVGVVSLVGLAVFLGHLYPVYFKFKGGKGVATALGVMIAVSPWLAFTASAVWGLVFYFSRYASLASIVAAIAAPIAAYFLVLQAKFVLMVFVLSALLVWRHRTNIQKLLAGNEAGFGKK